MNGLPEAVAQRAERLHAATRELIAAARAADGERIREAVDRRGEAATRLREALDAVADRLDPHARGELGESLAMLAGDAEGELRALQGRIREQLVAQAQASTAVRGYAAGQPSEPSALDRSR